LRQKILNVRRNEFLMGQALKHGDLLGSRFASPGRHIGFLIPRKDRGGTVDALNFQQPGGEAFQRRNGFQAGLLLILTMLRSAVTNAVWLAVYAGRQPFSNHESIP